MRTEVGPYDASAIEVLAGLEAIRRRPSMYIGSTGPEGLHMLVLEVVQNAVDEAMAGGCSHVTVAVHADGSWSVEDDGRGIPVDTHPRLGRPACEIVLTELHSGGKFDGSVYHAPGGLHGVGLAAVNALSRELVLDVWRDGGHYRQRFVRGVAGPLERRGESDRRGTRLQGWPDPSIFGQSGDPSQTCSLDICRLAEHLQAQAFLEQGLTVALRVEQEGREEVWRYDEGVCGYVSWLDRAREKVHAAPIHLHGAEGGVEVDVGLEWTRSYTEDLKGYVNRIPTPGGGRHIEGLKAALTVAINDAATALRDGDEISGCDVREGLTAVLSVRMESPQFEGQTKTSLTSAGVEQAVREVVLSGLSAWLASNPCARETIVGRALEASRARTASRRARDRARYVRQRAEDSRAAYREQFGIRASNWHASARWITDRALLETHASLCRVPPGARVLDACCGSGVVGEAFRGRVAHVTGLDLTPQMVAQARTRLDEVVQGDVYDMPFADGHFDLVVNREVLHLLPSPERPVSEMFRVLRPGGQIIVGQMLPYGAADAAWMFRILRKKQPLFFNHLLEDDVRLLLHGAGFVDVSVVEHRQWESIDTWIDSWETPALHRHEIRDLYHSAPDEVREVHPFTISPSGSIEDCWRWCVFSAVKPVS